MSDERPRYLSYLVRLWQANSTGDPQWRASVEDPESGQRRGFADLESLFAFLVERTESNGRHADNGGGLP